MRLTIDRDRCVGAGMCTLSSPDIFDQSPADGLVVLRQPPGPEADAMLRAAANLCPSGALSVDDDA